MSFAGHVKKSRRDVPADPMPLLEAAALGKAALEQIGAGNISKGVDCLGLMLARVRSFEEVLASAANAIGQEASGE